MIRCSTSLPSEKLLRRSPRKKKVSAATGERRFADCSRLFPPCYSLAPMATKSKKKPAKKRPASAKSKTAKAGKSAKAAKPARAAGTDPKRVAAILAKLDEAYPKATCELKHENAFQLLISTILSAQCTDVRVNQVAETLYKKYPDVKAFAYAAPR